MGDDVMKIDNAKVPGLVYGTQKGHLNLFLKRF